MISVAISRFDGPFDLLLALVRRNQYPLDALPIAEITSQYCSNRLLRFVRVWG